MRIRISRRLAKSPHAAGVVCALFAILLFAQSLPYSYVMDDIPLIQEDERLRDPGFVWNLWLAPWIPGTPTTNARPLTTLTFWAQVQSGTDDASISRLINVSLFAGLTFFVALLAAQWLKIPAAGWIVGILFATHPIHVEAVVNIVGRGELLSALFTVLALLTWLNWRKELTVGKSLRVAGLVFLAGLSKETGYLSAPMIFVGEFSLRRLEGDWRLRDKSFVFLGLLILIIAGLAFAQRQIISHRNARYMSAKSIVAEVHPDDNPLIAASAAERVVSAAMLLGKTTQSLVVPFNQSPDYSSRMLMPTTRLADPLVLTGLVALLAWLAWVVSAWRSASRQLGPLLMMPIAWIIHSNTLVVIGETFAERWMTMLTILLPIAAVGEYQRRRGSKLSVTLVGMVGLGMLVAIPLTLQRYTNYSTLSPHSFLVAQLAVSAGLLTMGVFVSKKFIQNTLVSAVLLVATVFFSWSTLAYAPSWQSWETLAVTTAQRHPRNGEFQGHASVIYLVQAGFHRHIDNAERTRSFEELAEYSARRAIELRPAQRSPYFTLACLAAIQNDRPTAIDFLRQFIQHGGEVSNFPDLLTVYRVDRKLISLAIALQIIEETRADPDRWDLWAAAAKAQIAGEGDQARSFEWIRKAISLKSDVAENWAVLSKLHEKSLPPDIAAATDAMRRALKLAGPTSPEHALYSEDLQRLESLLKQPLGREQQ